MAQKPDANGNMRVTLNLPAGDYEKLVAMAASNLRSLSAEVQYLIRQTTAPQDRAQD
jgi:hypothetical protein